MGICLGTEMKIPQMEALRRTQLEYHRANPWELSTGGLYIPYSHDDMTPQSLSYWDEVGFILNGRRVIVRWQHPRNVYRRAIKTRAWQEVGDGPRDNWLTEGGTNNCRKVGRSRRKLASYTSRSPSPEQQEHYDRLNATIARLQRDGIDLDISASWKWKRMAWAMAVDLVAPLEVRSESELANLAALARCLIKGKTTLEKEFPGYRFGRKEWLLDHARSLPEMAGTNQENPECLETPVVESAFVREAIARMQSAPRFVSQEMWDSFATYDGPEVSGDPEGRLPDNLEDDDDD